MKTKYVCRGLISLYVNFHNNGTMSSINLNVKNCRGGKKLFLAFSQKKVDKNFKSFLKNLPHRENPRSAPA